MANRTQQARTAPATAAAATGTADPTAAQGGDQGQGDQGAGDQGGDGGGDSKDAGKAPQAPAEGKEPEPERSAGPILKETNGRADKAAIELLMRACELFGIDPHQDARPKELAEWKFYAGNRLDGIPDAIVLVTMGGVKIKWYADEDYPIDQETEERLAQKLNAFRVDGGTKGLVRVPLPDDLTLPRAAVTGLTDAQDHRYKGGYLRSGGKTESTRREQAKTSKRR